MIQRLEDLVTKLDKSKKKGLAVVCAQDTNTIQAIAKAAQDGFITPYMIGCKEEILKTINHFSLPRSLFEIIETEDDVQAASKAVELVRNGDADILMKGLVSSSTYLKAILDKEKGLLPEGNVLSHLTVIELPQYHKLLFLSDVAVIPFPNYQQKSQMIKYALQVTKKFGISQPKISLLSATEKPTDKIPGTLEATELKKEFITNYGDELIIDGPLDVFLSLDQESVRIKGVPTPVNGDADVLIFPNIEAGNIFYKGSVLLGKGKIAAMLVGTNSPVILTSRSDTTESKYYSILLGCLMAKR